MKKILFYTLVILVLSSYIYSITPNDGYDDGNASNSSELLVVWSVMFNVTGSEQNQPGLSNVDISCNYTGFSQGGDTTNPYGPYGFPPGEWKCIFSVPFGYYDKTQTFVADSDKTVEVIMPEEGGATYQEHTWLEALYNCIILKDCDLWDLLITINQTAANIWEHTKPTDTSVIASEVEISNTLNSTSNITYDYAINIPIKAGYGLGDYLPVRIGYWFMNETNQSCYSQGTLPDGVTVIEPYCNPLMVQTIGPMGGSVSFRVDLRPNLAAGTYNVKRIIEIDPNEQWEGYGQEVIGTVVVTEDVVGEGGIDLDKKGEGMPSSGAGSPSSSSGGGSGGSGSGSRGPSNSIGSPGVSNNPPIINQNTYITNINNTYITDNSNKEEAESKSDSLDSGLGGITGATIKVLKDLSGNKSVSVIIITLFAIIVSLLGYIYKCKRG